MTAPQPPMTDADAAHEAHIKHHGAQMVAKFDEWARTGSVHARKEMDEHFDAFKAGVAARAPAAWAVISATGRMV